MLKNTRLLLILAIVVCGLAHTPVEARSLAQVRKDAFTVAIITGDLPFGYLESGAEKGFYFDLTREIATQLNARFRLIQLKSLQEGEELLRSNKVDAVIGGIKSTSSFKGRFFLTEPYFQSGLGIGLLTANKNVYSVTDLNGKYVAATAESGAERLLTNYIPQAKLEMASTPTEAIEMLVKGQVEAVIEDLAIIKYHAHKRPTVRFLDVMLTEDYFVIAINSQHQDLGNEVNAILGRLRTGNLAQGCPLSRLSDKHRLPFNLRMIQSDAPQTTQGAAPASSPTTATGASRDPKQRMDEIIRKMAELQAELQQLRRDMR